MDDFSTGTPANLHRSGSLGVESLALDITGSELESAMTEVGPRVVFHLAALSSVTLSDNDPRRCAEVNVEGTVRVWEAAARSGAEKMVNVSSLAVHGADSGGQGHAYGRSKRDAENYVSSAAAASGAMRYTTIRPANVYGPRQFGDGESAVVATWLKAMSTGDPLYLDGDGHQTRDFLFVEDAVSALANAADQGDGHTLEIGGGVETPLLTLLHTMARVTGWEGSPRRRPRRSGDIRRSVVDPGPASRHLGWRARTDLESGLRRTWLWVTGGGSDRREGSAE